MTDITNTEPTIEEDIATALASLDQGISLAPSQSRRLVAALRSERLQTNPLRYFVGTLEAELERERTQNRLDDDLLRDIAIASRAIRSQSWPGDMADEMDRRSRRIYAFVAARAALSTQEATDA